MAQIPVNGASRSALFATFNAIFLAEGVNLVRRTPDALPRARLLDAVLDSVVGLIGGACLHSPLFRERVGRQLRRL
jgi:hypothetical protein